MALYGSPKEMLRDHRNDPERNTSDRHIDDLKLRALNRSGTKIGLYAPGNRRQLKGMVGWVRFPDTPKIRFPAGGVYNPETDSEDDLDGWVLSSDKFDESAEDTSDADSDTDSGMWDDVDKDWVDYMWEREEKRVDPESVHKQQTGLRDFRGATQSDVAPESIEQSDERLDSLPAFLDDSEYEEVSKFTPGTGGPGECDHCNAENWWSHPLESGIDALRPGGIEHGDPGHDQCHADEIKGCSCCGCPRCTGKSIEFRSQSQDYRCNNCGLEFQYPVPRDSLGERAKLYWRCSNCGRECQAAFVGIPEDLLDASPDAAFDN
jgi:hypothetical protein